MKLKIISSAILVWVLVGSPPDLTADKADKHLNKGRADFKEGRVADAITEFREAQRLKPDSVENRVWLGLALSRLGAGDYAQGNLEKSIAEYREALQWDREEAYWHQGLAAALDKNGNRQGATEEYRAASELSPDDFGLRSAYQSFVEPRTVTAREDAPGKEPKVGIKPPGVGGSVTEPIAVTNPTPPYSDKARKAKYQGALVLSFVVTPEGDVRDEQVVKPLGLGLDQNALEVVRTLKFKPGTRDGVPVAVRVLVETTFKLF